MTMVRLSVTDVPEFKSECIFFVKAVVIKQANKVYSLVRGNYVYESGDDASVCTCQAARLQRLHQITLISVVVDQALVLIHALDALLRDVGRQSLVV